MTKRLKILACAAALAAMAPIARPALAANRAFSSMFAVVENPNAVNCFSHGGGYAAVRNGCSTTYNVFLPMTFDAAAWYTMSVYGQGWTDLSGNRYTLWCTANLQMHDNSSVLLGNTWQTLPSNGFGGPQSMVLGSIPIYGPGDAGYGYCLVMQNAKIFSYGWN
jgi:hypothetical protein